MVSKKTKLINQLKLAKTASYKFANISTGVKNEALELVAGEIINKKELIMKENKIDRDKAIRNNLSAALIDRLTLTETRIIAMAKGVREIVELTDPAGEIVSEWIRPGNLKIQKVRVPLGVIGIIYESRPNVTVDSIALCLKSGNALILRGGSETINSNRTLVNIISPIAYSAGIPDGTIQFIDTTDRQAIYEIIKQYTFIDLIIPRGSEKMINQIRKKAIVPILSHGKGLCHTYIDRDANIDMALKIAYNAKVQRPGVCNAMETLLVHKDIAKDFLPRLADLYKKPEVELRGCKETIKILKNAKCPQGIKSATEIDWSTEYLDLILSIKVVNSLEETIAHINKYGSGHSETIVTENKITAESFIKEIDAAAVFHNASTRLHDGGVFGLGAEIGISTQKLHARGTMGLKELTTTKYVIYGTGHVRGRT